MNKYKSQRRATVLIGVLSVGVVGFGVFSAWQATQAQVGPQATVEQIDDNGVCPADYSLEATVGDTAKPGGGPRCRTCDVPSQCLRLSCDPCCWICAGDPFPTCTS